jgi:hypothetical protein
MLWRLPKNDRVLILSENYCLLLPTVILPLLWDVCGVGYGHMIESGNRYFSDKMTLYNSTITVTKEQMTNHIPFHGHGEKLNIKMTFHMAFF